MTDITAQQALCIPMYQCFFTQYIYITLLSFMQVSIRILYTPPSRVRHFMRGFLPLLNGLLDAANLLKYVQHVQRYFCA
jgi:hypothetical protein